MTVREDLQLGLLSFAPWHMGKQGVALRLPTQNIDPETFPRETLGRIIRSLFSLMYSKPGGIGLAANMAGLLVNVTVMDTGNGEPIVMLNPRIESLSEKQISMTEANLCLPGLSGAVKRSENVTVSFQTPSGIWHTREFDGMDARVILHEISTLKGEMFSDLLPTSKHKYRSVLAQTKSSMKKSFAINLDDLSLGAEMHFFNAVTVSPALLQRKETVLRRAAEPVDFGTWSPHDIQRLAAEMFWLQHQLEGVGIAAPQVGFSIKLAVIDNLRDAPLVLINPEIVEYSDAVEVSNEGCLSLPWYRGPVTRSKEVNVTYYTLDGEPTELHASGYLARIIQHEVDHLSGILYADRLEQPDLLEAIDPDTLAARATSTIWPDEGTA